MTTFAQMLHTKQNDGEAASAATLFGNSPFMSTRLIINVN